MDCSQTRRSSSHVIRSDMTSVKWCNVSVKPWRIIKRSTNAPSSKQIFMANVWKNSCLNVSFTRPPMNCQLIQSRWTSFHLLPINLYRNLFITTQSIRTIYPMCIVFNWWEIFSMHLIPLFLHVWLINRSIASVLVQLRNDRKLDRWVELFLLFVALTVTEKKLRNCREREWEKKRNKLRGRKREKHHWVSQPAAIEHDQT